MVQVTSLTFQIDLDTVSASLTHLVRIRKEARFLTGPASIKIAKKLDRAIRDTSKTKGLLQRVKKDMDLFRETAPLLAKTQHVQIYSIDLSTRLRSIVVATSNPGSSAVMEDENKEDENKGPIGLKTKWCLRIKPGASFTDKNGDVYINENPHVSLRLTVLRNPQRTQSYVSDVSIQKE